MRTKGSKNRVVATSKKLIAKIQNAQKLLKQYRLAAVRKHNKKK